MFYCTLSPTHREALIQVDRRWTWKNCPLRVAGCVIAVTPLALVLLSKQKLKLLFGPSQFNLLSTTHTHTGNSLIRMRTSFPTKVNVCYLPYITPCWSKENANRPVNIHTPCWWMHRWIWMAAMTQECLGWSVILYSNFILRSWIPPPHYIISSRLSI